MERSRFAALHEQHVSPHAVELSEALACTDNAKPASAVQFDARDILGKDPALDGPDPGVVGVRDEGLEKMAADAPALRTRIDVHAVLDDARVCAAIGLERRGDPTDNRSVAHRDEAVLGRVRGGPPLE